MIISVTVTAKQPVTLDLEVAVDDEPTDPEMLENKVREAIDALAGDLDMEGYLAEWMATEGGGWDITVRAT